MLVGRHDVVVVARQKAAAVDDGQKGCLRGWMQMGPCVAAAAAAVVVVVVAVVVQPAQIGWVQIAGGGAGVGVLVWQSQGGGGSGDGGGAAAAAGWRGRAFHLQGDPWSAPSCQLGIL